MSLLFYEYWSVSCIICGIILGVHNNIFADHIDMKTFEKNNNQCT